MRFAAECGFAEEDVIAPAHLLRLLHSLEFGFTIHLIQNLDFIMLDFDVKYDISISEVRQKSFTLGLLKLQGYFIDVR